MLPISIPLEYVHLGMEFPSPCCETDDVPMDDCYEPRAAGEWENLASGHSSTPTAIIEHPRWLPGTARTVARLALTVLAIALKERPFASRSWTSCIFSESSRRGLPAGAPFGRGTVDAGLDPLPDGLPLPLGEGEEHVKH